MSNGVEKVSRVDAEPMRLEEQVLVRRSTGLRPLVAEEEMVRLTALMAGSAGDPVLAFLLAWLAVAAGALPFALVGFFLRPRRK